MAFTDIKRKEELIRICMHYNNSSPRFRPLGSGVMVLSINVAPSPYGLSHVKDEFSLVGLTACQCESGQSQREIFQKQ